MAAIGAAARKHDREFLFGRHVGQRNRSGGAQPCAGGFALRVGFRLRPARLALGGNQPLEASRLLLDQVLEVAETDVLAEGIGQRGRELGEPRLVAGL